ncbi:TraM recognition domain-containing protein [bacterium]|nr:TraM recognition domain-containing protein [bacterium]
MSRSILTLRSDAFEGAGSFACNDERTAKRISDMLGVTTETRAQMNYAGSRMAPWLGHTMVSRQEVPRPLLTPGEVMQLPPDEALILTGGAPPIRARKVRYFAEPVFKARLRKPFTSPRLAGDGVATSWSGLAAPPQTPPAQPAPPPPRGGKGRATQAKQKAFDFSTPPTPAPTTEPQPASPAREDDLGAALGGPTAAQILFTADPDTFDSL